MLTHTPTKEEMAKRVVRFADAVPYKSQFIDAGIPPEVMEMVTAQSVYPLLAPSDYKGRSALAPIKSNPGAIISIAETPPGNSPGLHCHETTVENFFCLNGRFEVSWGDEGENSIMLEPLDFISVPPGVTRKFTNVSSEIARLLVVIQPPAGGNEDRIAYAPQVGREIESKYGAEMVGKLEAIGFRFNAGQPE